MSVFVNPFTDFGFKRIFGQEAHKRLLIGFLNALFEGDFVVKDLVYRDKEQLGETKHDRSVIYDIYCMLDDGSSVIVEMQNKKEVNFDDRALYYASKSFASQGEKGDAWRYGCASVIGVYFLNFNQEGLGDAFRTDFEITKTRKVFAHTAFAPKWRTPIRFGVPRRVPFAKRLRMVFLQMPEFTLTEAECKTDLEKWAYIMNHMEKLSTIPWAAQEELYEELSKVSSVAALSQNERAVYEENLRQYRDNLATLEASYLDGKNDGLEEGRKEGRMEGRKEGRMEGRKEGRMEGRKEIVRNLMALNVSDEIIMRSTGMSLDEVQKLREEL
ncbi:MAG: Rpn family recombination-promoting nuclease/putative transposase [Proteobacteria bacterium]|nr:Rpn family recombination-promoting nuclease/putative transposase [Pseudomonadota bacterium]